MEPTAIDNKPRFYKRPTLIAKKSRDSIAYKELDPDPPDPPDPPASTSIYLQYRFEEENGNKENGNEENGNYDLTINGSPTFNNYVELDGVDDYLNVDIDFEVKTLSFWFNLNNVNTDNYLLSFDSDFYIKVNSNSLDFQFQPDIQNNCNISKDFFNAIWYNLALTSNNENYDIYLNNTKLPETIIYKDLSSSTLNIGKYITDEIQYLNGKIADLRLYNTIKTEDKINTIYNENIYVNIFRYTGDSHGLNGQTEYNITFTKDTLCEILIVGGGGAGYGSAKPKHYGGGGGGGAILYATSLQVTSGTYTVKVGRGGVGELNDGTLAEDGFSSEAFDAIAKGGSKGKRSTSTNKIASGGEGGETDISLSSFEFAQYKGGNGGTGTNSTDTTDHTLNGATGQLINIVGPYYWGGGGGGGGWYNNFGSGGKGGGAGGGFYSNGYYGPATGGSGINYGGTNYGGTNNNAVPGSDGGALTGGGGGGSFYENGGAGGSGIVIIKKLTSNLIIYDFSHITSLADWNSYATDYGFNSTFDRGFQEASSIYYAGVWRDNQATGFISKEIPTGYTKLRVEYQVLWNNTVSIYITQEEITGTGDITQIARNTATVAEGLKIFETDIDHTTDKYLTVAERYSTLSTNLKIVFY